MVLVLNYDILEQWLLSVHQVSCSFHQFCLTSLDLNVCSIISIESIFRRGIQLNQGWYLWLLAENPQSHLKCFSVCLSLHSCASSHLYLSLIGPNTFSCERVWDNRIWTSVSYSDINSPVFCMAFSDSFSISCRLRMYFNEALLALICVADK